MLTYTSHKAKEKNSGRIRRRGESFKNYTVTFQMIYGARDGE